MRATNCSRLTVDDGADDEGTLLRDLPTSLSSPNAATVLNGRLLVADNVGDELFESAAQVPQGRCCECCARTSRVRSVWSVSGAVPGDAAGPQTRKPLLVLTTPYGSAGDVGSAGWAVDARCRAMGNRADGARQSEA